MSVIQANVKKVDEAIVKNLAVENRGVSKRDKRRIDERYAKYAEGAKQLA